MKETLLLEHADLTYVTTPESLAAEQEVLQTYTRAVGSFRCVVFETYRASPYTRERVSFNDSTALV